MTLNGSKVLEFSWTIWFQTASEPFLFDRHLLPERLSTSPLTNTEPSPIFVLFRLATILNLLIEHPCIFQQFYHKELRHLNLDFSTSILLHNFSLRLEVLRIVGIKIESSVHIVTEEHRRIDQLLPNSKLLRSTIWIASGLLVVFQIFGCNLARSFPVARHWLVLPQ